MRGRMGGCCFVSVSFSFLSSFLSFGGEWGGKSGTQKWKGPHMEAGASVLVVIQEVDLK